MQLEVPGPAGPDLPDGLVPTGTVLKGALRHPDTQLLSQELENTVSRTRFSE